MKLLRLLYSLLAFSSTLFFLCWPTRVFADAQISDWVGQYTMNHDGFVGKLEILNARRKCNTLAWCALILRYTDAKAVPSIGRIESVDQNFQHMVFYLEFPGNPQRFDAYLFSW